MSRRHHSLRGRLLVSLLLLIAIIWLVISYRVYQGAAEEIEEIYDAALAQEAKLLLGLLRHEANEDGEGVIGTIQLEDEHAHPYELKIAVRARFADGRVVVATSGAPEFHDGEAAGFITFETEGQQWRTFTIYDPITGIQVMTAQLLEIREELVGYMLHRSLTSLVLGLPLFGVLIWWGVGHALRPLKRLLSEVAAMDQDSLHPLDTTRAPEEVQPLVLALNRLFTRLGDSLEKERWFTADAAHELRTPLSAIKTQAQVAQQATDPQQRQRALENIVSGVDRATHLANQLLLLARVDAKIYGEGELAHSNLQQVAKEVVGEMAVVAVDEGVELSLECRMRETKVLGKSALLQVLLRNLIDNAIRYTGQGGEVQVTIRPAGGARIELCVEDNGPGVAPAQLQQMFERFRRGGGSLRPGSGLGLSIVKRICDLYGATIELANVEPGSGLSVRVLLQAEKLPDSDQA